MLDWFKKFVAEGFQQEASELYVVFGKPAVKRIKGKTIYDESLVADNDTFVALLQELLPKKQLAKLEADEGSDFIFENFLFYDENGKRYLGNLQRQRGIMSFVVRLPVRDASILFELLKYTVEHRASDLHIREGKYARIRVDSMLEDTDFMTDSYFFQQAAKELLPPGKAEIYEQTGDFDFAWEEEGIGRFRVNYHRQRGKGAFTFRHVQSTAPTVKEASLPEVLKDLALSRNGIIFISGTTGSGKSTTMAAMLDHLNNTVEKHIITIEDPIEYTFQDNLCFFEQREVGLDATSFESALVHALRQDPDVIVVGEMRNRETFETALLAAETGHMVISTLHTKTAAQSIIRILDMYPQEERDSIRKSLSESLRAIICQRLAPRATGGGVMPINEILINTPIVRKLIFENKLDKIQQAIEGGAEEHMMSFNSCLLRLVNNGDITEETAFQFSDNAQALKMNLNGIFLTEDTGIIQ